MVLGKRRGKLLLFFFLVFLFLFLFFGVCVCVLLFLFVLFCLFFLGGEGEGGERGCFRFLSGSFCLFLRAHLERKSHYYASYQQSSSDISLRCSAFTLFFSLTKRASEQQAGICVLIYEL